MKKPYLENITTNDLPNNNLKNQIIYTQEPSTNVEYINLFGENTEIQDVWDDIYVFVYENNIKDRLSLIIKPWQVRYSKMKFLGFKTSKTRIDSDLPGFLNLDQNIPIESDQHSQLYSEMQDLIVNQGMPWSDGKINAIHRQNSLNYALKILSQHLPELSQHKITTHRLSDVVKRVYTFK